MPNKVERLLAKEVENTNSSVLKKIRRYFLTCRYCPPHKGENATRKPRHGVKKPKYKNKRTEKLNDK